MRVADLPEPWHRSPYLVGEHAGADVLAVWSAGSAVLAMIDGAGRDRGLVGLGDAAALADLCGAAARSGDPGLALVRHATLERPTATVLDPAVADVLGVGRTGTEWDWMWTPRPLLADPTGAERLPLGPGTAAEVAQCLARAHPTASTRPDDERVLGWWGVRHGGRLVAVVGALRFAPGLPPHLVSLGVDPAARGQGLAGVVTSAAVRDCLAVVPTVGEPMVSLGLYAANDVARRLYTRLGFHLGHRFTSLRRVG